MTGIRPADVRPLDPRRVYLDHLKAKGQAAGTRTYRALYLDYFLSYLAGRNIRDVRDVTPAVINDYRRHAIRCPNRKTGKPLAAKTVGEHLSVVKVFYAHLAGRGDVLLDPTRGLEESRRCERLPRTILTEREMAGILAQANPTRLWGLRDRAIMELLYSTGLRRRELRNLNVGDVDLGQGVVWVRKGKGGKDRVVPLGRTARRWVEAYLERRAGLFRPIRRSRFKRKPDPLEPALFLTQGRRRFEGWDLSAMIHRRSRSAGIDKSVTPYVFRHSCATHMVRRGANLRLIQELLGHADLKTTQIYTRLAPVDLKAAHRRHHPRGRARGNNVC